MATLNERQKTAIATVGDVFVTACAGSGKTRVLTEKILSTLEAGQLGHRRIAAVTFTNRAAEEIVARLQDRGVSRRDLWTGTIHAFALEWILRAYASCDERLRYGFAVCDDAYSQRIVKSLLQRYNVRAAEDVSLRFTRDGTPVDQAVNAQELVKEYREQLAGRRLIDFDSVLLIGYQLLQSKPEIARTLGALFSLICIDEYQDTQDLQYGILSTVVRASDGAARVFIVGDRNQAIYSSLGGVAKTVEEVRAEFLRPEMHYRELLGNYRSTQRIVDFCSRFCESDGEAVTALAEYSAEAGLITFENQTVAVAEVAERIATIVNRHLESGIEPEEICVLGPSWWQLRTLGRQLVVHLPDIDIDAPGLSPLRYQPDLIWFKLARLFLSEPSPSRYRARFRWAAELAADLESQLGRDIPERVRSPRAILRVINSVCSDQESGLAYLDEVFERFFERIGIDLEQHPEMLESRRSFFESAEERLIEQNNELESLENMRKMFRFLSGLVLNSCHGAKGEEYPVVICFGLLRGSVPHWKRIFDQTCDDEGEARRLLYVIASRAMKYLHLIAENGRKTKSGSPYETTRELAAVSWDYDSALS